MVPEAFRTELVALINKHSVEQCGDIPDYILAQHLCDHIDALHRTLKVRDKWFGVEHRLPLSEPVRLLDGYRYTIGADGSAVKLPD